MDAFIKSENICPNGLERFLENLSHFDNPIDPQVLASMIRELNISASELIEWTHFDPAIYARNRVALLPQVEVLVMCWHSGQLTPIHDHKGSACAIKIIQGCATEISYNKANCGSLVPVSHSRFVAGEVLHSYDEDIHQMGNMEESGHDLVTLHCYSPPLSKMKFYDGESAFFSEYDSLMQKVSNRLKSAPVCR